MKKLCVLLMMLPFALFAQTDFKSDECRYAPKGEMAKKVNEGGFFGVEGGEGFLWYCDLDPEAEEEPEKEKTKPKPPEEKKEEKVKEPKEPEGPKPLSVAWIKDNLPKVRDKAIDNPTYKNVQAFYYLQRYMMDKAHIFADMATQVTTQDLFLDEYNVRPRITRSSDEVDFKARKARKELMAKVSKKAKILFFYTSTCPYCVKSEVLLRLLERDYGAQITMMSLDGRPLFGKPFQNGIEAAMQAGVGQTPTFAMQLDGREPAIITEGVRPLDAVVERALYWAVENELIDKKEFEAIRQVKTPEVESSDDVQEDIDIEDSTSLVEEIKRMYEK